MEKNIKTTTDKNCLNKVDGKHIGTIKNIKMLKIELVKDMQDQRINKFIFIQNL